MKTSSYRTNASVLDGSPARLRQTQILLAAVSDLQSDYSKARQGKFIHIAPLIHKVIQGALQEKYIEMKHQN